MSEEYRKKLCEEINKDPEKDNDEDLVSPFRARLEDFFHQYCKPNDVVHFRYETQDRYYVDAAKWRLGVVIDVEYFEDDEVKVFIQKPNGRVEQFPISNNYADLFRVSSVCMLGDLDENIKVLKSCDSFRDAVECMFSLERDGSKVLEEI